MSRPSKLYHIASIDDAGSILKHGLRANADGKIFTITEKRLSDRIALTQLFLPAYALFAINPKGITGQLGIDEVAELSAPLHRVIVQAVIEPQFLKRIAVRQLDPLISKEELFATMGIRRLKYRDVRPTRKHGGVS